MDHKRFIPVNDDIEFENAIYGSQDDLQGLIDYTCMINSVMELIDWYKLCEYCYEKVFENYNEERISINEAIISFLANTSNLVESAKNSLAVIKIDGIDYKGQFDSYVSQIYDGFFSYRLLCRLRNYSQHGNFPVSVDVGGPCFDVMQIYNTTHYSFNKALSKEVMELCEDIHVKNNDVLKIDLAPTVMRHMFCIGKIYTKYLEYMQVILPKAMKTVDKIIEDNPKVLEHTHSPGNYILFNVDEEPEIMHAIDLDGNLVDEVIRGRNHVVEKNKTIDDNIKAIKRMGQNVSKNNKQGNIKN